MNEISVQKIPKRELSSADYEDLLARFCFKFPQYTYKQAKDMPYIRIVKMLKAAERVRAKEMIELANIIAGPHTKNGEGTKKMIEYYQSILEEEIK